MLTLSHAHASAMPKNVYLHLFPLWGILVAGLLIFIIDYVQNKKLNKHIIFPLLYKVFIFLFLLSFVLFNSGALQ